MFLDAIGRDKVGGKNERSQGGPNSWLGGAFGPNKTTLDNHLNLYIENIKNPKTSKKLEKEVAFKKMIADSKSKNLMIRQVSLPDERLISVVKHRQNALNNNSEAAYEDETTEIIAAEQGRTWQLERTMVTYNSVNQTTN